jgi:hydrogenase maturation protease
MSWDELQRPGPGSVIVAGVELRRGSHVRLRPRRGADVFDLVLAGALATVELVEEDMEGGVHLVVTIDDDPGRDLGIASQLAHRFFFAPDEVEPVAPERVLVAGIGNVFLGDDGFGVALVERLAERALPPGVEAVDFGIRGMDLAYALGEGWSAVVLLDAAPTGQPPGTLTVLEPEIDAVEPALDAHGMDPVKVLALAKTLGGPLPRTLVVACAPGTVMTGEEEDVVAELSAPVRAALEPGVELVESLLRELTSPAPAPKEVRP